LGNRQNAKGEGQVKSKNNALGPQVRNKRKETGALLPFLAMVFIGAGLQTATQFFAHSFTYQAVLGRNLYHVYAPWAILQWAFKWHGRFPREFMKSESLGMLVSAAGLLGVAIAKVVCSNTSRANEYLHGSARWAGKKDIQAAGLLPRRRTFMEAVTGKSAPACGGVYVGGWEDRKGNFYYLRHNGPEHILTYAPTRSGKGVGLILPTLLSWPDSAVITDLKGELWALTSGWRREFADNRVLRFEPAANNAGVCWNPLDEIRLDTENEVGDVQNLVALLVDPDGKGLETHWQKTAFALLVGVILHVLFKARREGPPATLAAVDGIMSQPGHEVGDLWKEMTTYGHRDGENHPVVGSAGRDMMDRPEEEAGSVLSTAKSYLSLYRDPIVDRNTSKSEFRIKDLMNHYGPVSLYIVTQPNDKTRLRPLVRVLVNMIVRILADRLDFENGRPKTTYRHRLLGMFDEFPSLGKLEIFQESLAFLAAYGIKCCLICQDITQLKSRETGYGPDETITSSCHIQNAYPPNRLETAEHLSRLTGQATAVKERITTSGRRTAAMLGHVSRSFQEVQRPLLTPDECLRMPGPKKDAQGAEGRIEAPGDMVVYIAGYPAIYGKQPLYFKDEIFLKRSQVPPPEKSDKLNRHEEKIQSVTI
jgi:type IV secretion system protein VirD4